MKYFKVFIVIPLLFCLASVPSFGAIFQVNSYEDVNDLTPGNGRCVAYLIIMPPFVFVFCSLRAAIEETNALPGDDVILLRSGVYSFYKGGSAEDASLTGDLDITDSLTIIGAGADKTFIDAKGFDRVFDVVGCDATVVLSGVTIQNGLLPADQGSDQQGGGGIRSCGTLYLDDTVITSSEVAGSDPGDMGGGLFNKGTAFIRRSSIEQNRAGQGGGVANGPEASLEIRASSLWGNGATNGGGLLNMGSARMTNATVSTNSAEPTTSGQGGGIFNQGSLELIFSTIAQNSATGGGGIVNQGSLFPVNTLIANNPGGDCLLPTGIISQGHNLDTDGTCGLDPALSDLPSTDPKLSPLRDHGSPPLPIHAIPPTSPAVNAGTPLSGITTDQRGMTRPRGTGVDIGAYEASWSPVFPEIMTLLLHQP